MLGDTCFYVDWGELIHSGVDLYREDGQSTAGAEVTSIADGIIIKIQTGFPGHVIIIEHSLGWIRIFRHPKGSL